MLIRYDAGATDTSSPRPDRGARLRLLRHLTIIALLLWLFGDVTIRPLTDLLWLHDGPPPGPDDLSPLVLRDSTWVTLCGLWLVLWSSLLWVAIRALGRLDAGRRVLYERAPSAARSWWGDWLPSDESPGLEIIAARPLNDAALLPAVLALTGTLLLAGLCVLTGAVALPLAERAVRPGLVVAVVVLIASAGMTVLVTRNPDRWLQATVAAAVAPLVKRWSGEALPEWLAVLGWLPMLLWIGTWPLNEKLGRVLLTDRRALGVPVLQAWLRSSRWARRSAMRWPAQSHPGRRLTVARGETTLLFLGPISAGAARIVIEPEAAEALAGVLAASGLGYEVVVHDVAPAAARRRLALRWALVVMLLATCAVTGGRLLGPAVALAAVARPVASAASQGDGKPYLAWRAPLMAARADDGVTLTVIGVAAARLGRKDEALWALRRADERLAGGGSAGRSARSWRWIVEARR